MRSNAYTFIARPRAPSDEIQRLSVEILGALHLDEHGVALLLRVPVLLRLHQALPDAFVCRSRAVNRRRAVEARDAPLGQEPGFPQRGLSQEHGDLGPVPEVLVGRALAALPERDVLVVED